MGGPWTREASAQVSLCIKAALPHPDRREAPLCCSETCSTFWFDLCGEGFILQRDNEPKHLLKLWHNYWRTKKTKESWLSWNVLRSHLTSTSFNFYWGTWRLREKSTLWHHKKPTVISQEALCDITIRNMWHHEKHTLTSREALWHHKKNTVHHKKHSGITKSIYIQWYEKLLGPFLISYFFACLSHLNVSDHETNLNIRQR